MVEVETSAERRNGVTVVRATVTNTHATPQVVRLESRLDGPTWAPRTGDVARPEWSDGSWEGTVLAGRSRGLGFASPAEPVEEPLDVTAVRRTTATERRASADEVLADLGDWAPTSEVLSREP